MSTKIKVIVTGSTGMVGEGVLHECLLHPDVESVLVINRKPCGIAHPKLKEIVHQDFFDLSAVEKELSGYHACFFCLGVSSVGMAKEKYYELTYTLTMHVAQTLRRLNDDMTFCYVSGASTDTTEQGRSNWARVKGKTENDIFKLSFKQAFAFRPGFIKPTPGLKQAHNFYKYINWMFPLLVKFFPNSANTLEEIGLAMIEVSEKGYSKKIIDPIDIRLLAENNRKK